MRVLILVTSADTLAPGHPTGVWLEEYAAPYVALHEAGIDIVVASPQGGGGPIDPKTALDEKTSLRWREALDALRTTAPLAEITDDGFDAIFVPGGHGPMIDLASDSRVAELIGAFARDGKIVAAVCHGPAALLNVVTGDGRPLLDGRKATGFTNGEETLAGLQAIVPFLLEDRMRAAGADFEHALLPGTSHVVVEGRLITGQNPASSEGIAKALLIALAERQRTELGVAADA